MNKKIDYDYLSMLFIAFALFVVFVITAHGQQPDPFEGMDSHDVPHCSVKGGPESAKCSCIGMVADIQREKAADCWKEAGFDDPNDIPEEFKVFPQFMPQGVSSCLASIPDHCRIVAKYPAYWGYKGDKTCRTSCRPDRCGCRDQACKAHGEPGAGY